MKYLQTVLLCLFVLNVTAQIGIGTTNPTSALEIDTSNSTLPPLELNPQTSPIGDASGQIAVIGKPGTGGQVIGGDLYLYDNINVKWLSVATSTFTFGREGSLNSINLEYAGDITASGPGLVDDGTIVYLTLNSSGGAQDKTLTLYIYDSTGGNIRSHQLIMNDGTLIMNDVNIDFDAGDYFMVKVNDDGNGNVDDVSAVIWTKWRKDNI